MISLEKSKAFRKPDWHELGQGVRVYGDLLDTLAESAARGAYHASLREQQGDKPIPKDEAEASKAFLALDHQAAEFEGVIASAQRTVTAWEGVDADCTPANVRLLMLYPGMAVAYENAVAVLKARWVKECVTDAE